MSKAIQGPVIGFACDSCEWSLATEGKEGNLLCSFSMDVISIITQGNWAVNLMSTSRLVSSRGLPRERWVQCDEVFWLNCCCVTFDYVALQLHELLPWWPFPTCVPLWRWFWRLRHCALKIHTKSEKGLNCTIGSQSVKLQCSLALIISNPKKRVGFMRQEFQGEFQSWPLLSMQYHLPLSCTTCAQGLSAWSVGHTCLWWDLTSSIQSCDQCQSETVNSSTLYPLLCQLFWRTVFCSWGSFKFFGEVWGHRHASLPSPDVCPDRVCIFPLIFPLLFLQLCRETCGPLATSELQQSVDTTAAK